MANIKEIRIGSVQTEKGKKMPKLIDANEILKSEHQHYDYMADEYYVLVRDIENAPTVDAEPVRHGRWIEERNPMMYQLLPYVWVCDQCGTAFYYKTPYCGECGAKMDEEEK